VDFPLTQLTLIAAAAVLAPILVIVTAGMLSVLIFPR
jgi:hypothetical protein